jgi:soluble cytochrome b562
MATFNFQPFVQQYVPAPVQEFAALGEALNQRYEKNVAEMEELDFLSSQIQTLPTSSHIKEAMLRDVKNTLRAVREKGDLENAAPRIREAVRRFRTDPNLRQAAENFQKAKEYDDQLNQMKLQGRTPLTFVDYRTEAFDDKGNLLPISADNQMQLDYRKRQETYFDDIKPESTSIASSGFSKRGDGLWVKGESASETAGITAARIEAAVNSNLNNYLQTPEGRQQLQYLTSPRYGNMSREQAIQSIRNDMMGAGLERVFQSTATKSSQAPIDDPYVAAETARLKLAAARGAAGGGQVDPNNPYTTRVATERVPLSGAKQFNSVFDEAFSTGVSPERRKQTQAELMGKLDEISKTGQGKAKEAAGEYIKFFNDIRAAYPESYENIIAAIQANGIGTSSSRSSHNPLISPNLKDIGDREIAALMDGVQDRSKIPTFAKRLGQLQDKYNTSRANFLWDSDFENAFQSKEATHTMPVEKIDYLTLPEGRKAKVDAELKSYALRDFEFVRSDNPDIKSMGDIKGDIELIRFSGKVAPGLGVGIQIKDKEGNATWVVPKSPDVINSLTSEAGINRPQYGLLNDIATSGERFQSMLRLDNIDRNGGLDASQRAVLNQGKLQTAKALSDALMNREKDRHGYVKGLLEIGPDGRSIQGINMQLLQELAEEYKYK